LILIHHVSTYFSTFWGKWHAYCIELWGSCIFVNIYLHFIMHSTATDKMNYN
jgi:hypothetical protein